MNRKTIKSYTSYAFVLLAGLSLLVGCVGGGRNMDMTTQTTPSVSQYGIGWYFDRDYQVGQFANGDYWVVGPVTITRITPDFAGSSNGWEVNPVPGYKQGFDSRCEGFSSSLVPSLPYTAQAGQSIVKAVSGGSGGNCLSTAAVLTVVSTPPANNGATVFRPPYVGTEKPVYSTNDLQTDLLPSLAPWGSRPSLSRIYENFRRVQLDHGMGAMGSSLHPTQNIPDYGSDIATRNAEGALGLMLNDPMSSKMNSLIAYVQYGIDLHHMAKNGHTWPGGGGWRPGQKLPMVFAATMLNDQEMINRVRTANYFAEDYVIQSGVNGPVFGWFENKSVTESAYWTYIGGCPQSNTRQWADPYGFIDGGCPTDAYQYCCFNKPWKAEAVAVLLMPQMQINWKDWNKFIKYVDRFVNTGTWTQPDPCAPPLQGGGPANNTVGCVLDPDLEYFNSPTDFGCQAGKECGRFPENHGEYRDEGYYPCGFCEAMWNAYR